MIPTSWKVAIVALLLAIAGTLGWDYSRQRTKLAETQELLKTTQAALKRTQAVVAVREKKRAATARSAASATASLDAAITAEPAWADQPVPKEIQDALAQ